MKLLRKNRQLFDGFLAMPAISMDAMFYISLQCVRILSFIISLKAQQNRVNIMLNFTSLNALLNLEGL